MLPAQRASVAGCGRGGEGLGGVLGAFVPWTCCAVDRETVPRLLACRLVVHFLEVSWLLWLVYTPCVCARVHTYKSMLYSAEARPPMFRFVLFRRGVRGHGLVHRRGARRAAVVVRNGPRGKENEVKKEGFLPLSRHPPKKLSCASFSSVFQSFLSSFFAPAARGYVFSLSSGRSRHASAAGFLSPAAGSVRSMIDGWMDGIGGRSDVGSLCRTCTALLVDKRRLDTAAGWSLRLGG